MNYTVRLPVFEGPIELLLYVIRRAEVDIADIPIARITDEYLALLRALRAEVDLGQASDFILVAAILVRLKVQSLLPRTEKEEGEAPVSLEQIIAEFAVYKGAARILAELEERQAKLFPRSGDDAPIWEDQGNLFDLTKAFADLLNRFVPDKTWEVTVTPVMMEEKLAALRAMLKERARVEFREVASVCRHLSDFVAFFIAALELVRRGEFLFEQTEDFGPIYLVRPAELFDAVPGEN